MNCGDVIAQGTVDTAEMLTALTEVLAAGTDRIRLEFDAVHPDGRQTPGGVPLGSVRAFAVTRQADGLHWTIVPTAVAAFMGNLGDFEMTHDAARLLVAALEASTAEETQLALHPIAGSASRFTLTARQRAGMGVSIEVSYRPDTGPVNWRDRRFGGSSLTTSRGLWQTIEGTFADRRNG